MVSKNLEGLTVKKIGLFTGISQEVRFVCRDCVRIILARFFRIVCAPCLGLFGTKKDINT
jgi:hypothetical protein